MASSLVSWIEPADLSASEGTLETGQFGPIASALDQPEFGQVEPDQIELDKIKSDQIVLIYDRSAAKVFAAWLKKHTVRSLYLHRVKLSSSRHFPDVKQPMLNK
ncbi:hypothetical protein [uncultured Pseudoteredinibacter sp.]|uniref:hypothetical protein n=1 Tax=uncultured Pseudoteredinibacter sp. TaxID=1641701 RepID=UPI002633BC90|nr:hypothetical protein [uncultured Pseudoteredinibacter sp.]